MSADPNPKDANGDKYYPVEHILCERRTLRPDRNGGKMQYLVKYENYEFDGCFWIHAHSFKPHGPDTPFAEWNLLDNREKRIRYNFLNKPKDFMSLSPKKKIQLGWKYVNKFKLEILTQTPSPSPSQSLSTISKSNTYSWRPQQKRQS